MRCPECTERNSVAAAKCKTCGFKFKKKPVSKGAKITVAAIAGLIVLWAVAAAVIPAITDPEQNLARIAKRVAQGPASGQQAEQLLKDFDQSLRNYLAVIGGKSDAELVTKLQKLFPSSAFEIHIVDLPRGLKIVEVDTVLQANGYLVMKENSSTKVFPLTGLEVFDDARLINESAGPILVLLGHSGGQPPHRPHVRIYALLPDGITDETEKLLPTMNGDGAAKFANNGRDIDLSLSLLSLGQTEKLFARNNQNEDGIVHQYLEWKDAHYVSRYEYGSSPFVALYAVARCMRYPDLTKAHSQYLGSAGEDLVKNYKSPDAGDFQAVKLKGGNDKVIYRLKGNVGKFDVTIARAGGNWQVVSSKVAQGNEPVVAAADTTQANSSSTDVGAMHASPAATSTASSGKTAATDSHVAAQLSHHKDKVATAAPIIEDKPKHESETSQPTASTPAASGGEVVNLRSGPSTTSAAIDQVPAGGRVEIIGHRKDWYKVRFQGKVGYIFSDLIKSGKVNTGSTASAGSTSSSRGEKHKQASNSSNNATHVADASTHKSSSSSKSTSSKSEKSSKEAIATPPPDSASAPPPIMP